MKIDQDRITKYLEKYEIEDKYKLHLQYILFNIIIIYKEDLCLLIYLDCILILKSVKCLRYDQLKLAFNTV